MHAAKAIPKAHSGKILPFTLRYFGVSFLPVCALKGVDNLLPLTLYSSDVITVPHQIN